MSDFKDKITDAAANLGETASNVAHDVRAQAEDAWDTMQYKTNRAVRHGSNYIRKNPVPTALTAFGLGLALGLLLARRDHHQEGR